jgi:Uma2 family endonuclease
LAEEGQGMHMAMQMRAWTLDEVHRLPDDGNKYELVRGELFVTPAPTVDHETIIARLARVLEPYAAAHGLGLVYRPRAVLRFEGSEVEPDLMVRQPPSGKRVRWEKVPVPILVIEVLSPFTRRRDREQKRAFYIDAGVAEYWIVDPESESVTVVRPGCEDVTLRDELLWRPRSELPPLAVLRSDVIR